MYLASADMVDLGEKPSDCFKVMHNDIYSAAPADHGKIKKSCRRLCVLQGGFIAQTEGFAGLLSQFAVTVKDSGPHVCLKQKKRTCGFTETT